MTMSVWKPTISLIHPSIPLLSGLLTLPTAWCPCGLLTLEDDFLTCGNFPSFLTEVFLVLTYIEGKWRIVPDYMHCILLGIAKKNEKKKNVMNKWFSSVESGKDYFIGKRLKKICKCPGIIKPPDFSERLPKDNWNHIPFLRPHKFRLGWFSMASHVLFAFSQTGFWNTAQLSEATHILLRVTSKRKKCKEQRNCCKDSIIALERPMDQALVD